MSKNNNASNNTYYEKGDIEPRQENHVILKKMEKRRLLTSDSTRLVLVLVGLPGRGKSFIARKLYSYFVWRGSACKVFNVGKYRRAAVAMHKKKEKEDNEEENNAASCDANFFDANNKIAAKIRHESAALAMKDVLVWLDNDMGQRDDDRYSVSDNNNTCHFIPITDRVAIFDATNSTKARRTWIVDQLTSHAKDVGQNIGIVFVESICDDEELLEENFRNKVKNSPDFKGIPTEDGIADLRKRVKNYEAQYETITDDSYSYIKIFNLSSKLMANQIYGRMSKTVVPALMAWNIGTRPIWICRAGQTLDEEKSHECTSSTSGRKTSSGTRLQGESLGVAGRAFRDDLRKFMEEEGNNYMVERSRAYSVSLDTGTSISGGIPATFSSDSNYNGLPFPVKIMSSTMPRAWQTVLWDDSSAVDVGVLSNLNPLDKGDFTGLELPAIRDKDPDWYAQLEADPYNTRFPGGECYRDLVSRLESCIIDVEQAVSPVLVVSHVSVIQVLLAYFRGTPVQECTKITVPMHTIIKLKPVMGGGWSEEHEKLSRDNESNKLIRTLLPVKKDNSAPIWDDHDKIFGKDT